MNEVTRTGPTGTVTISTGTGATGAYQPDSVRSSSGSGSSSHSPKKLESAVYSYIQAMRALGKTGITTSDIAAALGVSTSIVNGTLDSLKNKGVKIAS